jgi:hypothetical protein
MRNYLLLLAAMIIAGATYAQEVTKIKDIQYVTGEDLKGDNGNSPLLGEQHTVQGVVTAISTGSSHNKVYIQDGEGVWNGLYVYDKDMSTELAIGDVIQVSGTVAEWYNFTELVDIDPFEIIDAEIAMPAPVQVSTTLNESFEGVLATVENATLDSVNTQYGLWYLSHEYEGEKYSVTIDDIFFAYTPEEGKVYNVTGVVEYSHDEYKINPRNAGDIIVVGAEDVIAQTLSVYPNPANNVIYVDNAEGQQIRIYNVYGQMVVNTVLENSSVDVASLEAGIYVVTVGKSTTKIVIE